MSKDIVYSLSTHFDQGYNGTQMKEEVEGSAMTQTLISSSLSGDVVTLHFDAVVTGADLTTLNALVLAHSPESSSVRFKRNLGDADATISTKEFKTKHLRAPTTAPRTYSFKTATKLLEDSLFTGDIWIMNQGSSTATVAVKAGGSTISGMSYVVAAGTTGHFRWRITGTAPAAYEVLRL